MKKISNSPVCFSVMPEELKYGMSVRSQLKNNPEAKKLFKGGEVDGSKSTSDNRIQSRDF